MPAGTESLPPAARAALEEYLAALDEALPGTVRGVYVTVDPPHRAVFTWGVPGDDALPPGESTVEVVLTPDADGTRVVLTHRGLPAVHLDGHRAGWEGRLGSLPAAAG